MSRVFGGVCALWHVLGIGEIVRCLNKREVKTTEILEFETEIC
jgi:hypothetical protein